MTLVVAEQVVKICCILNDSMFNAKISATQRNLLILYTSRLVLSFDLTIRAKSEQKQWLNRKFRLIRIIASPARGGQSKPSKLACVARLEQLAGVFASCDAASTDVKIHFSY